MHLTKSLSSLGMQAEVDDMEGTAKRFRSPEAVSALTSISPLIEATVKQYCAVCSAGEEGCGIRFIKTICSYPFVRAGLDNAPAMVLLPECEKAASWNDGQDIRKSRNCHLRLFVIIDFPPMKRDIETLIGSIYD